MGPKSESTEQFDRHFDFCSEERPTGALGFTVELAVPAFQAEGLEWPPQNLGSSSSLEDWRCQRDIVHTYM